MEWNREKMNKTNKKPLICTIDRSEWARGKKVPKDSQSLLNEDGTKCCLGFLALKCQVPDDKIQDVGMPYDLCPFEYNKLPILNDDGKVHGPYDGWNKFANINDDADILDKDREAKLRQLAKDNGFRFRFVSKTKKSSQTIVSRKKE